MECSRLLWVCLFAFPSAAQVPIASQWAAIDGQYDPTKLMCVRAANAFLVGGALNLLVQQISNFCPVPSPGATKSYNAGGILANTFTFQYGTVVVRAMMPGLGVHSGGWLLDARCRSEFGPPYSTCATPTEVDIMDYVPGLAGNAPNNYNANYFNSSQSLVCQTLVSVDPRQWHTYMLRWNSTSLTWYADGVQVATCGSAPQLAMMPLLTTEVQTGVSGIGTYPLTMVVDYEHICSDPTATCAAGDPSMIFSDEFTGNDGAQRGVSFVRGGTVKR